MAIAIKQIQIKWIFLIFLILLIKNNKATQLECLSLCKCYWASELYEADCSYRHFEQYPNRTEAENIQIDMINFSHNKLLDFPYFLAEINQLSLIDLTDNRIKRLRPYCLDGFKNLKTLILNNNYFSSWNDISPYTAFAGATKLETLSLANNPITSNLNVDETFAIVSKSIVRLDLSNCQLTKLTGEYMLNDLKSIEHLILNDNPLKILTPLRSETLKKYDLSDCQIEECSTNAFQMMPNLIHLNLSANARIKLKNSNGQYVTSMSLLTIDLSNCNLDTLDINGFNRLTTLIFNGNLLRKITSKTFENNLYLESLDLSRNSINHIDLDAFKNLQLLKKLDLSLNEISKIDTNMFIQNNELITLNLNENFLNRFHQIHSNTLINLYLNHNHISKIDADALTFLRNLSILDLSYNEFAILPHMLSSTLEILDLRMCRLITINNRTFSGYPILEKLDLSGNRFTKTFRVSYFHNNPYLKEIRLYDNLWECDCEDKEFKKFYQFYNEKRMTDTRVKHMPQCGHPINSVQNTWGQACKHIWLPSSSMGTPEKIWTIIFSAILVFVACLCLYTAFKRAFLGCRQTYNRRILRRNERENREIQRQNQAMLQQQPFQNAPNTLTYTGSVRESQPPCYEDALLMPKMDRSKSLADLNPTKNSNKRKLQRTSTNVDLENDHLISDQRRFLSEEQMLELQNNRIAGDFSFKRRQQRQLSHDSRFNANDIDYSTKFPRSHLKTQNLQSAERIAVLNNNSHISPYSSRKWKMHADSISFASVSDDDLGVNGNSIDKQNKNQNDIDYDNLSQSKQSPYSRRRPRGLSASKLSISRENINDDLSSLENKHNNSIIGDPEIIVVDNHFNGKNQEANQKHSDTFKSSTSSEFDKIPMPSKEQSIESINSDSISTYDVVSADVVADEQMIRINLPIKQSKF